MPQRLPSPPVLSLLRRVLCLLSVFVAVALPQSSEADLFYKVQKAINLTDSGLNPGADGTIPMSVTGLNDAGAFVGYFPSATANKLHAFLWDNPHQTFIDLNNLLAADSSMATCINDNGTVAGYFWELGTYAEKGFIYYPDGTATTFTSPDGGGGNITAVTAINATGDLVGTYVAVDGTTRGFIVQQGSGSATITDLGDLGQTDYKQYIWPNALNEADQVVGNVYLFPVSSPEPPSTQGFFWDSGMTLIDASDLSTNWTAVSLNSNGQVVGLYDLGTNPRRPFTKSGSYYWAGDSVADLGDLGDLGGGAGANVFAMTEEDFALGTSLGSDGLLHLFETTPDALAGNGPFDLGSVSLYDGDTSFLPLSLDSIVTRRHRTGYNIVYDIAGFGTDANGNTLSLLWMNNAIHSVVDLMPSYLSFTTISHAHGSLVLINDSQQIACAGTDSNGHQMALLLSIDPDTDNDGLPDSWEMQYFGHLGVDKNALEVSGGGLTNGEAYEQGVNPVDFYSGQTPSLSIVSGDSQIAAPGSFVPTPLIVQVTDASGNPISGAPVTFTVTSGDGQLQVSRQASPKTTVTVLTDANGQAKVFFQVSNTAGVTSGITAVLTGANLATVGTFSGTADNSGPVNPTPTDPSNPATPQDVPVQGYACIDVSSSVQGSSNIRAVALDDSNNVAFAFSSQAAPPLPEEVSNAYGFGAPDGNAEAYVWSNGQLSADKYTDLTARVDVPNGGGYGYNRFLAYLGGVDTNGTVYGSMFNMDIADDNSDQGQIGCAFSSDGSGCSPIALPSPFNCPVYTPDGGFDCISPLGSLLADTNGLYNYFFDCLSGVYIYSQGQYTVFDKGDDFTGLTIAPNLSIQQYSFYPAKVNNKGAALGVGSDGSGGYTTALWTNVSPSVAPVTVGAGNPAGLNDQNQAVVKVGMAEGYFWENGTQTVLTDHLPAEIAGKISNIQPTAISNQTTPGTDATIYILATANVTQPDGTVAQGATIVCSRDNDGVWSFGQVGVPNGTTISQCTTINSSGTIAGIGSGESTANTTSSRRTNDSPTPTPAPTATAVLAPRVDLQVATIKLGAYKYPQLFGYAYQPKVTIPVGGGVNKGGIWRDQTYKVVYTFSDDSTLTCNWTPWLSDTKAINEPGGEQGDVMVWIDAMHLFDQTAEGVDTIKPISNLKSVSEEIFDRWFFVTMDGDKPVPLSECVTHSTSIASVINGVLQWNQAASSSDPDYKKTVHGQPAHDSPQSQRLNSDSQSYARQNEFKRAYWVASGGKAQAYFQSTDCPFTD